MARCWWWWLVVGCGGDTCERLARADEDCGATVSDAEVDACRDRLAACSAADVEQVEAWFACTEAAGATACEPSTGALDAALDCVSELDGLTDACDVGRTGPLGG